MKKMEGRAILCLILAAALIAGLVFFIVRLVNNGDSWASFYANQHVYKNGVLAVGSVYDRNGEPLLENDGDGPHYNADRSIRRGTAHVVGDENLNVSTAVNYAFRSQIIGYNFITGTNGFLFADNRQINLTIDADVSAAAFEALGGRNGFVGVYNWRTGDIICMVSSPGFDPAYPQNAAEAETGTYMNKVLSGAATPGSTFKLVTVKAALENIPDIENWSFTCSGTYMVDGEKVTCQSAHGRMDINGALANSCNCAFASLTLQIGDTSADFNKINFKLADMDSKGLGIQSISIKSATAAGSAISLIKAAINTVSTVRGTLGAIQNRLDHTINNLSVMTENIQDAESTIRDTDVADEMMAYTKNNILVQSAQAMLAQANQVPQGVLQLLQ